MRSGPVVVDDVQVTGILATAVVDADGGNVRYALDGVRQASIVCAPQASGARLVDTIVTGEDQVLPPSVDFDSIMVALVPPQSPVGPVGGQRCQET